MILQNIWKGVIGNALVNISPEILSQLCFSLIGFINPSNAKATFIQSKTTQRILKTIFQVFCIILCRPN